MAGSCPASEGASETGRGQGVCTWAGPAFSITLSRAHSRVGAARALRLMSLLAKSPDPLSPSELKALSPWWLILPASSGGGWRPGAQVRPVGRWGVKGKSTWGRYAR